MKVNWWQLNHCYLYQLIKTSPAGRTERIIACLFIRFLAGVRRRLAGRPDHGRGRLQLPCNHPFTALFHRLSSPLARSLCSQLRPYCSRIGGQAGRQRPSECKRKELELG
ncbi:hypothetical protein SAY87_017920 [Trapa incisa]|uniref:Uncharacterized protein n=1 Tax=Trapa incisa TaxID=236973 RepID=A0AAN7KWM2_9MYRT|nr:hypothetical protein SAY87_017920 [Trapa incisa]